MLLLTVDAPAAGLHELELACNLGETTFIDFVQVHLHGTGKMNVPSSTQTSASGVSRWLLPASRVQSAMEFAGADTPLAHLWYSRDGCDDLTIGVLPTSSVAFALIP